MLGLMPEELLEVCIAEDRFKEFWVERKASTYNKKFCRTLDDDFNRAKKYPPEERHSYVGWTEFRNPDKPKEWTPVFCRVTYGGNEMGPFAAPTVVRRM